MAENFVDRTIYLHCPLIKTWMTVRTPESYCASFRTVLTRFMAEVKLREPMIPDAYVTLEEPEICVSIVNPNTRTVADLNHMCGPAMEIVIEIQGKKIQNEGASAAKQRDIRILAGKMYEEGFLTTALRLFAIGGESAIRPHVRLLREMRDWRHMFQMRDKVMLACPMDVEMMETFAVAFAAVGQYERAQKMFKKAFAISNDCGSFGDFASVYMEGKEPNLMTAEIMLKRAIRTQNFDEVRLSARICQYFCLSGQLDRAFKLAFTHWKVVKCLGKMILKHPFVKTAFVAAIKDFNVDAQEAATIAEGLYRAGCVEEALIWCEENRGPILVSRIYLTILFNEGLYRGFQEVSSAACQTLPDSAKIRGLQIQSMTEDFLSAISVNPESDGLCQGYQKQTVLSERDNCVVDIQTLVTVFSFCSGSDVKIDPKPFQTVIDRPFWRIRQAYDTARLIAPGLTKTDIRHGNSIRVIDVIGDDCVLYSAYRKWHDMCFVPRLVLDISVRDLRKGHKCGTKSSFWNRINMLQESECGAVILVLGNKDCEFEIPRLLRKGVFIDTSSAVCYILEIYSNLLDKVIARLPNTKILVHPVITRERACAAIIDSFNFVLQAAARQRKRCEFMNVFQHVQSNQIVVNEVNVAMYKTCLSSYLKAHTATVI